MSRFIRLSRVVTAAAAAIAPMALFMASAHAATWTNVGVDNDAVVLGTKSGSTFKAFNGNVESWIDGTNMRATLTGPFIGRGTLTATWTFHDNSTATASDYTDGVEHDINFTSPAGKSVVRFTFSYTPNSTAVNYGYTYQAVTDYVWDSPMSVGSCGQLDRDSVSTAPSGYGSYQGTTWFGCNSSGRIVAQPNGTTHWDGVNGTFNRTEFVFRYTDGTEDVVATPWVAASSPSATVSASSSPTKTVVYVGVQMQRADISQPAGYYQTKIGDETLG